MADNVLLRMEHVSKSFPGVKALEDINLEIKQGEILALVGENGAGKSTLMKILSGIYTMDEGSIILNGEKVHFIDALDAQKHGISTIHQELNMIPGLGASENIFIGREIKARDGISIDWKKTDEQARALLARVGIHELDLSTPVRSFSAAVQQMISIARALSINSRLVIMDEPTSSLDSDEVRILFDVMRNLKAQGIAIVFISHRIDEIFEICERVTILKDGRHVGTHKIGEITKVQMISEMIGRDATEILSVRRNAAAQADSEDILSLEHGFSDNRVKDVSMSVQKGRVVGLAGLLGAGRTEIARLLFGLDKLVRGRMMMGGREVHFHSPRDAIRHGLAFCPENRRADGIVGNMSVRENITLALLPKLTKYGFVDVKRQKKIVEEFIQRLGIKTPSIDQPIRLLSGGNQQKVILARWMCVDPDLMILDEPTRGIDVGAKQEIEKLIKELAEQGIGVLMISSEMSEVIRNSDRVDVIRDGRKIRELYGDDINQDEIMNTIGGAVDVDHIETCERGAAQ
ncbi:MAG: sugar ABC transporter ATP-binding protein [Clostridia bacterium]|nr:sugar ABC transporter ATP-binding protein [Clostridia bacterium]